MSNNKKIWLQIAFIVSIGVFVSLSWKIIYPILFNEKLFIFFAEKDGTQSDTYIFLFYDLCMVILCILFSGIFAKQIRKIETLPINDNQMLYADEKFSAFFWASLIIYHFFISSFSVILSFPKMLYQYGTYIVANAALPIIFIICYRYFSKREPKVFQRPETFYQLIPAFQIGCCTILSTTAIIKSIMPTKYKNVCSIENIICDYLSVPLEFLTELIINPKLLGGADIRFFCNYILPYCFLAFFCLRFFRATTRRNIALKSMELKYA